jgi:hypothetical protein
MNMRQCYVIRTLPILLKYEMHQVTDKGSNFTKHEGSQPHIKKERVLQSWAEHDLFNRTVFETKLRATLSHPILWEQS